MNGMEPTEHRKGLSLRTWMILAVALCLAFTAIMPVADASDDDGTDGLQDIIDGASTSISLTRNYNTTATVDVENGITINGNGYSINYTGNGSALDISATSLVTINNLNVNATTNGAYGITISSTDPNVKLSECTIKADTRGISMYPVGGSTGSYLEITSTDILNSRITDYENDTTVGDTRGIALFDVENSQIKVLNGSTIRGFGYSINTSNNLENGIRAGGNTYTIEDSSITGWSAFNVWTVGNTFNITNSILKGISDLDGEWNNFATFVINNGIYNGTAGAANNVNIKGGEVSAYKNGTADHNCFLESSETRTNFTFIMNGSDYVTLKYDEYYETPFTVSAPATTITVSGIENTEWIMI